VPAFSECGPSRRTSSASDTPAGGTLDQSASTCAIFFGIAGVSSSAATRSASAQWVRIPASSGLRAGSAATTFASLNGSVTLM
jgi:hypothetical protein